MEFISTARLKQCVRRLGDESREPVVLLHGNGADSAAMLPLASYLQEDFYLILPDLRGYGHTERALIDARAGAGDWVEDLFTLLDALGIERCHLLGWSLGGAVAMAAAQQESARLLSLLLLAPVSPFGFGGTCDLEGSPNFGDCAGSGGGIVGTDYAKAVAEGRESENAGMVRQIMRHAVLGQFGSLAHGPGDEAPLDSLYRQDCGAKAWPGDCRESGNWPGVAPGDFGPMNAISPKYFNAWSLADADQKPPILRIQGAGDVVISDASQFDIATLGMLGMIPGWPGLRPQPMVSQMTRFLEAYGQRGGVVLDRILPGCGHAPNIQFPEQCARLIGDFIRARECP